MDDALQVKNIRQEVILTVHCPISHELAEQYKHISQKSHLLNMLGLVAHGGAFFSYPQSCRAAHYRGFYPLEPQFPTAIGFRVILAKEGL